MSPCLVTRFWRFPSKLNTFWQIVVESLSWKKILGILLRFTQSLVWERVCFWKMCRRVGYHLAVVSFAVSFIACL